MQPSISKLSTIYFFSLLLPLDEIFPFRHKSFPLFLLYGGYKLVISILQALVGVAQIVER